MFIKKSAPKLEAWDLLKQLNINSIPVDPYEICSKLNIWIKYKDLDSQGIFILKNCSKLILLNENIKYEARKRFTIAHEIGHYIIPYHENVYNCSKEDIEKYQANDIIEREANEFAAELLMPERYFNYDVDHHSLTLNDIQALSQKYLTSLTSTAIKFIKHTKDTGAIFLSKDGIILWAFRSETFPYSIAGGKVDECSNVYDYYNNEYNDFENPQEVPSSAWLEREISERLFEQSIPYPSLNMVLTLLTLGEE
jgi:Zn-dependent peptidase ImmA (M78 family)